MSLRLLLILPVLVTALLVRTLQAGSTLNIRDLGAAADGSTLATDIIQHAIDQCSANGGGTVEFPEGRYLSGTIQLKDGVTLQLDKDAVLLGSTQVADYRVVEGFKDGLGVNMGAAFILALDTKRVAIKGPGTIDGQGAELARNQKAAGDNDIGQRPLLIRFVRCEGINLGGIKVVGSARWTIHLSRCNDVRINRVEVSSYGLPHNDGIDIDSCQKVEIKDCEIHSGDDSICFKTLGPFPCRDISVDGCTVQSGEAGIKFGTESMGAFANIVVSNCSILGASEGGIKLFSVDGAVMQDIRITNIKMRHVNLPIMIRLGARLHTFRPGDNEEPVGSIKDISISNVEAIQCSNIGILLSGIPGHVIENLSLQNIRLELAGGETAAKAAVGLKENEKDYPEVKMFGNEMPVFGIYARHVDGLKIDALTVTLTRPDQRPSSFFYDVSKETFTNWNVPAAATDLP